MKIKTYPGRVIDASESPEKHSSMGLLYEANWANTNERIIQAPHLTYSKSNMNISSLGKYQDQLERAKEADQSSVRKLREFHGYMPSTLKLKKTPNQYNEWDSEPKSQDIIYNPLYNHAQNNWHSSDYLTNVSSKRSDPKLRRSQTVIVKQPTISTDNVQGEIDLRDFYRRRHQLRQSEETHLSKYPSILPNGIQTNCDTTLANDSLYSNNLAAAIRNNSNSVNSRMNCYKTANFFARDSNRITSNNCENEVCDETILLNPLARNKTIRINHFDTLRRPQLKPEEINGGLRNTEGLSEKKAKTSSFSRMFATISAGTKFPRVFLGRGSKNQRAKLNLEELNETVESNKSNSSLSTLSSSPVYPSSPSAIVVGSKSLSPKDRKQGSATSSDSESFVIPRPRLIAPVHTYARKRRTGNLAPDQSISKKSSNCDRNKGKMTKTLGEAMLRGTKMT